MTTETETTAITVREPEPEPELPLVTSKEPLTPAQARVDSVADVLAKARANASMLRLTPEEIKLLKADFPDDAFKLGAGGDPNLIYIEHASLRDRFDEALGMCQWAMIRSRPHWAENYKTSTGKEAVRIYADCALIIRGCLVAEAIGEMSYFPNNATQNYGDAVEGSETAAFRRCAKKIGVGLQAWKKDFGEGWKQRQRLPKTKQQHAPARSVSGSSAPTTPQPGESGSPTPSPGLPFKVDELLEASKNKFLRQLAQDNLLLPAWVWAVGAGIVMENEQLTAANASRLFVSVDLRGTKEAAIKAISKDHDWIWEAINKQKVNLDKNATLKTQMQSQFDAIYGPPGANTESPAPPAKAEASKDASSAEWFWDVIISIPRKGQKKAEYEKNPDTIGSLYDALKNGDDYARSRLFGLANDWECKPREYNGKTYPPSEGDKATRKALDAFLAWEEAKAKEGCDDAREAVDDDSPPF